VAAGTARALARERAKWVKERARAELVRLQQAIAEARERRKAALLSTRETCSRARARVRERVKAFRAAEIARINREAAEMRAAARNQCKARRYRIQQSGAKVVEKRRAELDGEARLQAQLERAGRHALRQKKRSTAAERAQESDDAVRSNLPAELVGVFDRVRRHIKGSKRVTRTEAFLEWAESHPEDVLEYQEHETDREVRRLVAEHEAAQRALRKTGGRRAARQRAAGALEEVPF
jgi:hypothetical protein